MANPKHLKILKQGGNAWNKWRVKNPEIIPDLEGADLVMVDLGGANLGRASLGGADLRRANLRRAQLNHADLNVAKLTEVDLYNADLTEANLRGADLFGADFTDAILIGANLHRANLSEANLSRAGLHSANLDGAILTGADLSGAVLIEVNLRRANLGGAILSWALLDRADLSAALLDNSDFMDAHVARTVFGDNDLSTVKELETVHHLGPSTIGIDTIYKSKGKIPEAFLRGAGVPEDFIVYTRSLVGKPIEFYSCFISYSTKDDDFAQRLHADLQQKGVRCWFAPEDLKIGDKFRMRIDESIRVYDKLMVVLSENSIRSRWVEEEVEAAFEEEDKQKKLVLFPIRLDDAVMETDQAWAASLRRTRHIGDFRAWKDHDPYQKSSELLLRDLKA